MDTSRPDPRVNTHGIRLFHRLIHLRYSIPLDEVLNPQSADELPASRDGLAAELLRMMRAMRAEAIAPDGRQVDYARLKHSAIYQEYRACTRLLRAFDPAQLDDDPKRMAFWINLYNALSLDAVLAFGVQKTVTEVQGFFWRSAYSVGGRRYCSFDIEYGILRANGAHPAIPGAHFGGADARRHFSLTSLDPRVHFALVCAARSCPPIAAYDPEHVDAQLDLAARNFVNNGGVELDFGRKEVVLSKIFQWYAKDFGGRWMGLGGRRSLIDFVLPYLDDDKRDFLRLRPSRLRFQNYDWRLNLVTS